MFYVHVFHRPVAYTKFGHTTSYNTYYIFKSYVRMIAYSVSAYVDTTEMHVDI